MNTRVFIIAEAGVNHNGDLDLAMGMVDAAAEAGADAVKFQTFKTSSLAVPDAPKAEYQMRTTGSEESQFAMLRRLELDKAAHLALSARCRERNIEFLSSPFDLESLALLEEIGMPRLKIPSGEIVNLPLLRAIAGLGREVILSTGMCGLSEVEAALSVLDAAGTPRSRVTVLHCHTEYPSPYHEVNLRAMDTLARSFGVRVGYSDHTPGIEIPLAAVALGATVLEKHFTLDRTLPGPDHAASLVPGELARMVEGVRRVELALGDGIKRPSATEMANRMVARKSIVASRDITKGERLGPDNLAVKRPAGGICPMRWDEVVGTLAARNYRQDELI